MEQRKKSAIRFLAISLVLMLLCSIVAFAAESNFGKTQIKTVEWVTEDGVNIAGSLYVPAGTSAENPAPGIVLAHGMYCERTLLDAYYTELSRRGYVVLAYDQPSHGLSDTVTSVGAITTSGYEAVKFLTTIPYVDQDKIGISGHSLGGSSANTACELDVTYGTNYIASALINSTNPTYAPRGAEAKWSNVYGNIPVGLIASHRDEMGFSSIGGSKNYIDTDYAQSFLHFGKDPADLETRANNTYYQEEIDGETALRIVYTDGLYLTHSLTTLDPTAIGNTIEFFETTLGAPNPIAPSNQIWFLKKIANVFNCVGLIMFLLSFTTCMLFTPLFASLRQPEIVKPRELKPGDKKWFWALLTLCPLFSVIIYLPLLNNIKARTFFRDPWTQPDSWGMGVWTMIGALFMLSLMTLIYFLDWRKQGVSLIERGIKLPLKQLGKTIALAVISVASTYSMIFIFNYFFHADFRISKVRFNVFSAEKLLGAVWPYGIMFLVGFICSAVANNCFNYKLKGEGPKAERKNLALCCVMSAMPCIILVGSMYGILFLTGNVVYSGNNTSFISWLVPMVVTMPVTIVIGRKLYQLTKNPYLSGIICGLMMTMMKCMQTLTWK